MLEARLAVNAALARALRERARELGVSVAGLCHLAWAMVLSKVSGRDDVVFGTVLFGRLRGGSGADRAMGLFINTLPLRIRAADVPVRDAVMQTQQLLAQLLEHEHAPLTLAQRCSGIAAPAPLFSALLNYRHSAEDKSDSSSAWDGVELIGGEEHTNYPLDLSVDDLGDGLLLTAQAHTSVDAAGVCRLMHTALEQLARALEHAPATPLRQLQVLPEEEREQLLVGWNRTDAPVPHDRCIHELFEQQVARAPDATAVQWDNTSLTYGELNARANRLAHHLRGLGVGPDTRVVICAERSPEMVIALLATLKAGGAYVPLDPTYPTERLAYMLRDCEPAALLVTPHTRTRLAARSDLPVIDVTTDAFMRGGISDANLPHAGVSPRHLAYVIYTSGSTGAPKGVMVEHRSAVNLALAQIGNFSISPRSRVLQFASFTFDACVEETLGALLAGATLVLRTDAWLDADRFWGLCGQHEISMVDLPTQFWQQLAFSDAAIPPCVHRVVIGGEAVSDRALRRWFERAGHRPALTNTYGPTETTVVATLAEPSPDALDWCSIGRPLANTRIYVLDHHGQPVPVGVAGEIHIAGVQVARGYLHRPELTAERFVPDRFSSEAGARMYRSGDLGRWLPDGTIEFLGRNDHQVKIRGFRVEVGEIEARLGSCAGVREAVVSARDDGLGGKRLVAYLTGDAVPAETLRAQLSSQLPEYMVPAAFVHLHALPLTPSGKLDRKALPAPEDGAYASRAYAAPRGDMETQVAALWAQVLHVERVGRHDNFFDLGGHSLLAVQVLSRLRQTLGVELPLAELFAHPVLAEFCSAVMQASRSTLPPITLANRGAPLPLSFAQQRLWFLAQIEGAGAAYHMPGGVRLHGTLDRAALRRALERIVQRHESLRTRFIEVDGHAVQIVDNDWGITLLEHDLTGHPHAEAEVRRLADAEAQAPFELERGPLVRARLIELSGTEHVLLLTMHHIVSDGWSMGVLVNELGTLYAAFAQGANDPLPALAIQYADYAAWQRRWLSGEVLQRQAEYWKNTLSGAPALLALPTDHPRPAEQSYAGGSIEVALDAKLTSEIKALSRRHGATPYMTLMAAWGLTLARLSDQEEVVVGTPASNRSRPEIEPLIGLFINTLALRLAMRDAHGAAPTVAQLLAQVKAVVLGAHRHQDLPFEQVIELVQPERSMAHSPLFQVMLAWQNMPSGAAELPGSTLR